MNINFAKEQFEIAKKASHLSETIVIDIKTVEQMISEIERLQERNSRYAEKITELKEKIRYKEILDKNVKVIVNDQAKKVKHLFPLENTAGYGQLCDKVIELENLLHQIIEHFINRDYEKVSKLIEHDYFISDEEEK